MTRDEIEQAYLGYIACLNAQDWGALGRHVATDVTHNGTLLGVSGYRAMLVADFKAIPDLSFRPSLLACDPPMIASRLDFDCRPVGSLFDMLVNGRRVQFSENVFYAYEGGKIKTVWSVIDKAAIRAQL